MYFLQVVFLTGRLLVGGIENKAACDDLAIRLADVHGSDFVGAYCDGPEGSSQIERNDKPAGYTPPALKK
jgi:hypothetical protein